MEERYFKLKVLEKFKSKASNHLHARCKCDCGNEKIIRYDHIKFGKIKSCGCFLRTRTFIDIKNKTFGKLNVISHHKGEYWNCKCDCGNTCICKSSHLRKGKIQSCGCYRKTFTSNRAKKKPYEWLYNILKRNCHRSNKSLNMSLEEFVTFTSINKCHYCNSNIVWYPYDTLTPNKKKISHSYHLDRKDNTQGYTSSNCVVCCSLCNYIKSNLLSYEEMSILAPSLQIIQNNRQSFISPLLDS